MNRRSSLQRFVNPRVLGISWLIEMQVEELAQALSFQATDLESQGSAAMDKLRQAADGVLRSDDKLLSSLKKLGQELDPEDPEEKANIEKLRETCMR